jgi:hypothetical protein
MNMYTAAWPLCSWVTAGRQEVEANGRHEDVWGNRGIDLGFIDLVTILEASGQFHDPAPSPQVKEPPTVAIVQ